VICGACAAAGRDNKAGNGFDASILHDMCVNYMLYDDCPQSTWCDCQHVTVPFEEPAGCPSCNGLDCEECMKCDNCDGRKCMDCVCRITHEVCLPDCPECCVPPPGSPLAEWEKELLEGIRE
jgi:hypothetical protein